MELHRWHIFYDVARRWQLHGQDVEKLLGRTVPPTWTIDHPIMAFHVINLETKKPPSTLISSIVNSGYFF